VEAARRDGQSIVAQAGQIGEQLKDAARQEARQEAEVIVARARVEIDRERDAAIDELRRQFTDLAIMAAEKVINETLDKERHRRIIDEVLEQAPRGKD
ncbi:MAG: F0F1 ATP synthase subunit B, partial [Dehalococcoidia bacterium]|nr:F0F1 ATP synthase subunit B [Dehalococcoidia bacterium]